jgi:hypothetical protein
VSSRYTSASATDYLFRHAKDSSNTAITLYLIIIDSGDSKLDVCFI